MKGQILIIGRIFLGSLIICPGHYLFARTDTLFYENFDGDLDGKNWTTGYERIDGSLTASSWELGEPVGGVQKEFRGWKEINVGNPDPVKDHTPGNDVNFVFGQGLDSGSAEGEATYYNSAIEWLQTPEIYVEGYDMVALSFFRWANFEPDRDSAIIRVSSDGVSWHQLDHQAFPQDTSWVKVVLDISDLVDSASSIYVRWYSVSNKKTRHSGWNIDDFTVVGGSVDSVVWNGKESTDWDDIANWSPAFLPNDSMDVIISDTTNHGPVISSHRSCKNLTIESGASVIITADAQLDVMNDLNILSDQNGTGVMLDKGVLNVFGSSVVQQYVSGYKYHFIGAPVDEIYNEVVNSHVYYWDEYAAKDNWNNGWKLNADVWKDLKGYNINPEGDQVIQFEGKLRTGFQTIDITSTDEDEIEDHEGWNLVANTYPSPIDWDASKGWKRRNVKDAIYIWDPDENNYKSYVDGVGTNGGSRYIPAMQGFFVKAKNYSSSGNIEMDNRVRVVKTDFPFKNSTPSGLIRLRVDKGTFYDETVVRFNNFATDSFDHQIDAYKKSSTDNRVSKIYTRSNDIDYSINAIPENDSMKDFEMPVYLKASVNGSYEMSLSTTFVGCDLVIEDVQTGEVYPVKDSQTVPFDVNTDSPQKRFILKSAHKEDVATNIEYSSADNNISVVFMN
ncbi:MAG: hypothetical protein ACOC3T_01310 [Bacteroidota bacterium]